MSLTFPRKQILTKEVKVARIKVSGKISFFSSSFKNNLPGSHFAYHTLTKQNFKPSEIGLVMELKRLDF